MGEAIAQFRELALAVRRTSDEAMVHPGHLLLLTVANPLQAAAAVEQLKTGRMSALKFADLLRKSGGLPGVPDIEGLGLFDEARRKILARGPRRAEIDRAYTLAVREAARHSDLLDVVERRLNSLRLSTIGLIELAGDSSSSRFITHKRKYAAQLERWHEAYEALAAFIEEPADPAATSEKKTGKSKSKKRRDRPGAGGRKPKWSAAKKRQILSDREQHEKQQRRLRKPPEKVSLWRREWATRNEMTNADARLLWQAAKRDKYR